MDLKPSESFQKLRVNFIQSLYVYVGAILVGVLCILVLSGDSASHSAGDIWRAICTPWRVSAGPGVVTSSHPCRAPLSARCLLLLGSRSDRYAAEACASPVTGRTLRVGTRGKPEPTPGWPHSQEGPLRGPFHPNRPRPCFPLEVWVTGPLRGVPPWLGLSFPAVTDTGARGSSQNGRDHARRRLQCFLDRLTGPCRLPGTCRAESAGVQVTPLGTKAVLCPVPPQPGAELSPALTLQGTQTLPGKGAQSPNTAPPWMSAAHSGSGATALLTNW